MSRAIRQTAQLTSYSSSAITFSNPDGTQLNFTWSPSTRVLTMTQRGVPKTLLNQCDYLYFNISQRNPTYGTFGFYSATNNAALCKLVDVSWRCSRSILGKKINTESVQTAKIVIRN